jgi:hypothetical protein
MGMVVVWGARDVDAKQQSRFLRVPGRGRHCEIRARDADRRWVLR